MTKKRDKMKTQNTLDRKSLNAMTASSIQSIHKLEHIDIELTRQCNLKCIHCSAGDNTVGQELSVDDMKKILSEAQTLGLKKVGFTGGEPLLRIEKLHELLNFCRNELGIAIHLHTNGTMISRKVAEEIKRSENEVTITFYGFSSKTHDAITQIDGSMKSSLKGLRRLLLAGVDVFIHIVPMKCNLNEIIPLIKMISEKGCKRIRILSLSPTGRAMENFDKLALNDEEEIWLNRELAKARQEMNVELYGGYCTRRFYPELKMLPGHYSCLAAENRVHIDAFGNIFPCTASSGRMIFSAGNLQMPGYTLSEIWHHSPFFQFIREFHSNPPDKCQVCTLQQNCMSGCRVIMSYKYGDITIADPKCKGPF